MCTLNRLSGLHYLMLYTAYSSRRDSEGRLPIHYLSGQPDVGDLVDILAEASRLVHTYVYTCVILLLFSHTCTFIT